MGSRRALANGAICLGAAVALVTGCSSTVSVPAVTAPTSAAPTSAAPTSAAPTSAAPTSASAAVTTSDTQRAAAYARVQAELTDFLAMWKAKGYAEASQAYLAPDVQATSSDDVPVLASGRVVTVRPDQWTSADLFVVYVDFDLTFSGNSGAWGTGTNSRFVTAASRTGSIPYVLDLATGP